MTVVLGENLVGALNALASIPVTDGEWRLCARDLLIRPSHFRIRRLPFSRASVDSHDPLSTFEALVDIMLWRLRVLGGGVESGALI